MRFYAGIGARQTPPEILQQMEQLGAFLTNFRYGLRSGAADGADAAFERGCSLLHGLKEIYLPWKSFNNHSSPLHLPSEQAMELAEFLHPAWNKLTYPVQLLMARNVHQILGITLDQPCEFVVCWTADGCTSQAQRTRQTGGTGQAIAIADYAGIPVFNLKNDGTHDVVRKHVWDQYRLRQEA